MTPLLSRFWKELFEEAIYTAVTVAVTTLIERALKREKDTEYPERQEKG